MLYRVEVTHLIWDIYLDLSFLYTPQKAHQSGASSMDALHCQYSQIAVWTEMAHDNWHTIENFPDLIAFANIKEMKQNRQLQEFQNAFIQRNLIQTQLNCVLVFSCWHVFSNRQNRDTKLTVKDRTQSQWAFLTHHLWDCAKYFTFLLPLPCFVYITVGDRSSHLMTLHLAHLFQSLLSLYKK